MKNLSLLFLSFFILGLICTSTLVAATISSTGTNPGTVSTAGVATGGGLWSAATTWVGGVVPTSADSVIIVSPDLVIVGASANALSLTVQTGAKLNQGAGVSGTGTFTLASGSWWYASYGSATKMPQGFVTYSIDPASNWVFTSAASSSLINLPPSAGPVIYGNVFVYKTGAVLTAITSITDINIQGNLTINFLASTLKLTNNKSSALTTIHIGGNVYIISGTLSAVDAVAQATTCIVNIDGSIAVGDASTTSGVAALAGVSAPDAGYLRTGIYNINGDLSYINGATFEAGTNGTSTNTSESAVINLKGNLSTDATVIIAANTPGTFQVNFVGNSTKTMTLGDTLDFSCATILGINKTAGDVQLGSPVTIAGHVTLTLTSGKLITTSSNIVTIIGTGAISGGSSASFVNGPLAYSNTSTSLKSFIYPLGKGSAYRPITLSLTQGSVTSSTYTAEMFNSAPLANALPGTLDKVSTIRNYKISEGIGGSAFTAGSLLLNYDTDDGVTVQAQLRIAQGPSAGGGTWVNLGGTGTASTTGTITSTNSFTDLATNTIFTLADNTGGTNPLPVDLSSFTSSIDGRDIQLNWETKTEVNTRQFEIDRALVNTKDAIVTWASVGIVQAAGTSVSPTKYSYTEKNLQAGKYQYRLKMIDNDGSYKLSDVVETEIALPKNFDLRQNYPNPFNPSTTINYTLPFDSKIVLEVYNLKGARVCQLVNEEQLAGYYSVDFNSSLIDKNIPSGVYFYRINAIEKVTGNNFSVVKKMMLLK